MSEKKIYDEQDEDEALLEDKSRVQKVLEEFHFDDIFNAYTNDINPDNIDLADEQVIEEQFETEETERDEDQKQIERAVETAIQLRVPIIPETTSKSGQKIPDSVIKEATQLLNRIQESNVSEIGQEIVQLYAKADISSIISEFCGNFEQNQNLAATLALMLYYLYVFIGRDQYIKLLQQLISNINVNVLELLSFCVHFRCFSPEALIELTLQYDLDTAMAVFLVCGNVVMKDCYRQKDVIIEHYSKFRGQKLDILNDFLSKSQQASLFCQSYMEALEKQYTKIKQSSVKMSRRQQAEYAFIGWKVSNYMEYSFSKQQCQGRENLLELVLKNTNSPTAVSDFSLVLQNNSDVEAILTQVFREVQAQAYSQFFEAAFSQLVHINQMKVKTLFFDYYKQISTKTSNSVAQVSRLLAYLVSTGKLQNVITLQLRAQRESYCRREVVFYDLFCLHCVRFGLEQQEGRLRAAIEGWLKHFDGNEKLLQLAELDTKLRLAE